MTLANVTRIEALAQEVYDFANHRLPDHATPIIEMLNRLGIDHDAYCQLEKAIGAAIAGTEHNAFVAGFVISSALSNVPIFHKVDKMDEVLRPDLYDAEQDKRDREDANDRFQRWMY
jgi:hypothetical protein